MSTHRKPRICDVAGCDNDVAARGLCHRHYMAMRKGKALLRRGENIPRASTQKPWEYENAEGERQLMAQFAN
jgi:hypothetical protein